MGAAAFGTRITSLPYTISAPGSYYLGSNLSYAGGDGIIIASDHVTLDLMGYILSGPGSASNGIYMDARKNVEIRNGTVSGWNFGISEAGAGFGHRIINVRAEGNVNGIHVNGSGHLIKGCRATAGSGSGKGLFIQYNGTVSGCLVRYFTNIGIDITRGVVNGNVVVGSGSGDRGIYASAQTLIMGNEVTNCATGISCNSAATVIGNTVTTLTGQVGVKVSTTEPTVLDQNTSFGNGTHYQGITTGVTVTRNNCRIDNTRLRS